MWPARAWLSSSRARRIDGILAGRVWMLDINQGWALGVLALMTIPTLMVCISLMAPAAIARLSNLGPGAVYALVSLANSVGESWAFFWLGSAVEMALLVLVIRFAWSWPREASITPSLATAPPA